MEVIEGVLEVEGVIRIMEVMGGSFLIMKRNSGLISI